jgi:hypothetical protein
MNSLEQKVLLRSSQRKGCMLCDLGIGILEETAFGNVPDFEALSAAAHVALRPIGG